MMIIKLINKVIFYSFVEAVEPVVLRRSCWLLGTLRVLAVLWNTTLDLSKLTD